MIKVITFVIKICSNIVYTIYKNLIKHNFLLMSNQVNRNEKIKLSQSCEHSAVSSLHYAVCKYIDENVGDVGRKT